MNRLASLGFKGGVIQEQGTCGSSVSGELKLLSRTRRQVRVFIAILSFLIIAMGHLLKLLNEFGLEPV